ncbi:hypothetical protein FC093_15895 [Ilyomonas limi]|uniref:Uncharacterized protein n=1 Tax=Ilyomonas limi TaxID=2575867 RepID=A0A4U3KX38_9BACT|nr:hypothetical protein [Ilyomonas limi]TKK66980.1 hypothetical protein FC093_15895 [Ilyomonas limi]
MKRLLLFGFLFILITSVIMSCQKELSYEADQSTGHGTLYDTANSCQPMVPNGTYYNGVSASRDTNYVKVVVTITQTGTYELNTGLKNGFGFSDSGYFAKLGVDTLLLHAYGTPILNVPTDFTLTLDSSTCGFTINVQDSTGTGLGGDAGGVIVGDSSFVDPAPAATNTWHFTDSTSNQTYSGIFDVTNINDPQGGFLQNDTLFVVGQSSTTDTLFGLKLVVPAQNIVPGTIYPVTANNIVGLQIVTDPNNPVVIYGANDQTAASGAPNGNSYITITSYSNGQLAGSFHVYAQRSDGILVLIAGSFDCTVR